MVRIHVISGKQMEAFHAVTELCARSAVESE